MDSVDFKLTKASRCIALFRLLVIAFILTRRIGFGAVNFSYDSLNRLTNVDYGNGAIIRFSYDPAGNQLSYAGLTTNGGKTSPKISGAVSTYSSAIPVAGVTMNITGDTNTTTSSDLTGAYGVSINAGGSYTITPQKTTDNPVANGVTTADITLIRRHILNITPFASPFQLLAADVTGAGSVTTADITNIRRLILAVTNAFPAGLWRFVPANYAFPDPQHPWTAPTNLSFANVVADANNQDFVAIKLGDVNSSLVAPAVVQTVGKPPAVEFRLGNLTSQPHNTVRAPITVAEFNGVTSVQFTLKWDPAVLQFIGASDLGLRGSSTENFGTGLVKSGELTFSWDDQQGSGVTTTNGASIFTANFEVHGPVGSVSSLALVDSPTLSVRTIIEGVV